MKGKIRRPQTRKGFTIIELLVVVIVIGVLAAAGIGKYQGFAETARAKTCVSNQQVIESAVAMWLTNNTALNDTAQGAQWWRKDGHSSSHGWSTPPPFSDTYDIANIIRDNRVFMCPKISQAFQGQIDTVPNTWAFGVPNAASNPVCWAANYLFYYNGPSVGGSWNGGTGFWYDPSGNRVAHSLVWCGMWGGYNCDSAYGVIRKYIHSSKWQRY